MLKTLHFDIYYPEYMPDLAIYTSKTAEESYVYLADYLKHELNNYITILINPADYAISAREFINSHKSTDTISLKFSGSYESFHEELTRNLVYSFQYDILYDSTHGWRISHLTIISDFPEMLIDGIAAFLSEGYDVFSDMIIREITLSNNAEKYFNLSVFKSRKMHKDLQAVLFKSFLYFLETEINQDIAADLLIHIKEYNDLSNAIESASGTTISDLNAKWIAFYKNRYSGRKETSYENGIPAGINDSIQMIPIAAFDDRTDLSFLTAINKHVKISKVNIPENQNINILLYQSSLRPSKLQDIFSLSGCPSVSNNSKTALLVERAGGRDVIAVYDLQLRKKISEVILPFIKIRDAHISADGKYIVFSGQSNISADLYIYGIENKSIRRITDDLFCKRFPKISPDNSFVVFSSNENPANDIESKKYKIIRYDLVLNAKSVLIDNNFCNIHADISADSKKIIYASDISGIFNIYCYDIRENTSCMVTDVSGCALFPLWLPGNKTILFTEYHNSKYRIILQNLYKTDSIKDNNARLPAYKTVIYPDSYFAQEDIILKDYSSGNLHIFSEAGAVVWNNGFAGAAGIKAADFLREQELELYYDYVKHNSDRNSNYYLDYKFLRYIPEIGFGSFYVINPLRVIYFYNKPNLMQYPNNTDARKIGTYGFLSYPFIKGLSAAIIGSSVIYENIKDGNSYKDYYSNELCLFVSYDSIIYNKLWPVGGTKCELSYSRSFNGRMGDLSFSSIAFNINTIFRFNRKLALDIHAAGGKLFGEDKDFFNFYAGGFGSVRGHDIFSYSGLNAMLCNLELRFSIFERLTLKWPVVIKFNDLSLALLADFGSVWDKDYKLKNSDTGRFEDLKAGIGAGIRFYMLDHIVFKLDTAWPYYYRSFGECEIISGFEIRY